MLDFIANNPFRVLGVAANASAREIVSNKNKMNAFLKVNRPVSFPLDLVQVIGPVVRTADSVTAADTALTVQADRLRAALFWWIDGATPFDKVAFQHIAATNLDDAVRTWEKQDNMSSLANRALAYLITGDVYAAAATASKLYSEHAAELTAAIDLPSVPQDALAESYVATLTGAIPSFNIGKLVGDEFPLWWRKAVRGKLLEPILTALNDALSRCRKLKGADYDERYRAGEDLDKETAPLLRKMRQVVSITDVELVNISDKIANEILQCSIDAYNDANDMAYAEEALKLLVKARHVALGSVAKDRIKENENILRNILASMPPSPVRADSEELDGIFSQLPSYALTIDTADSFLNQALPILQRIASKLPADRQDFAVLCNSNVANAILNTLVAAVNSLQGAIHDNMDVDAFKHIRNEINRAQNITASLLSLELNPVTEARVKENLDTIQGICSNLAEVKTGDSCGEQLGGCFKNLIIYCGILILFSLIFG